MYPITDIRIDQVPNSSTVNRLVTIKIKNNPEINILNYWLYKIIRRSEWVNIDLDAEVEVDE